MKRISPKFALLVLTLSIACEQDPTQPGPVAEPRCGDGVIDQGEECDDGNDVNTDACMPTCLLARCGDGLVQVDVEACDDANADDTDACLTTCVAARCGDGLVQVDVEACDDGNEVEDDACTTGCRAASCGDGIARQDIAAGQPGYEACDDGNEEQTDACLDDCVANSCGDGFEHAEVEGCDDGNDDDTDACTNLCAVAACGDGIIRTDLVEGAGGFESCDDGNDEATDSCTTSCQPARCGDAVVYDGVEQCDDGNDVDDDDCGNTCGAAFVELAAGKDHSCGRYASGQVRCWGENGLGQLGDGSLLGRFHPTLVDGIDNAAAIFSNSSAEATCALLGEERSLSCWGKHFGASAIPLAVGRSWHQVSVGDLFGAIYAIDLEGMPFIVTVDGVEPIAGLGSMSQLSASTLHRCGRTTDGAVFCWGYNQFGRLGTGNTDNQETPTRVQLPAGATQLALSAFHVCALLADDRVFCWGSGLGFGEPGEQLSPVEVSGLSGVERLVIGGLTTVALRAGGELLTKEPGAREFSVLQSIDQVTDVVAGSDHRCALDNEGAFYCWGSHDRGQLGLGGSPYRRVAHRVANLPAATKVRLGSDHSCALLTDQTVRCWGGTNWGRQLGVADRQVVGAAPVRVTGLSGIVKLAVGHHHSCAIDGDGGSSCWGRGSDGQLGSGDFGLSATAAPVAGQNQMAMLSLGRDHSCGVDDSGEALCWGKNTSGQLGHGNTDRLNAPQRLGTLSDVQAIGAGTSHSCALSVGGQVSCWGSNRDRKLGRAGDDSLTPIAVEGLSDIDDLSCGADHNCALRGGSVICWGRRGLGALGVDDRGDATNLNFAAVAGLGGEAAQVAAGWEFSCARLINGGVRCWGYNQFGQLGDNGTVHGHEARTVAELPASTDIATGLTHACSVAEDGAVYCWGGNRLNQLGDGSTGVEYAEPTRVPMR